VFEIRVVEHGQRAAALAAALRLSERRLDPTGNLDPAATGNRATAGAARGKPERANTPASAADAIILVELITVSPPFVIGIGVTARSLD
jgi:hypothetical protein